MPDSDLGVKSLADGGNPETSEKAPDNQPQTQDTGPEWVKKLEGFDDGAKSKLARYKTVNDLAKSALEFDKRISASVVIPGKDATKETWDTFYKRLGRPESQDEYELEQVYLPDGVSRAEDAETTFKKMAFDLGLTKDQAKRLYKHASEQALSGVSMLKKTMERNRKEAAETLKKDYGSDYDKNIALVQKVNKLFGDDSWVQYLNEGAGNEPRLVKFLVKVAKQFSEDTLESGRLPPRTPERREPGLLDYGDKRPEITGDNRFRRLTG